MPSKLYLEFPHNPSVAQATGMAGTVGDTWRWLIPEDRAWPQKGDLFLALEQGGPLANWLTPCFQDFALGLMLNPIQDRPHL